MRQLRRGHIAKRAPGSWTLWIELPSDPATGKRRRKTLTVNGTKRDAERQLTQLAHQVDTGLPVDSGNATIRDYLTSWLRDVVAVRNRPRTAEGYRIIVNRHIVPILGGVRVSRLQPADVEVLEAKLLSRGLSANTVHHVHVVLSKALKDATRKGLVSRNVCQLVEPPRPARYEVDPPDSNAIARILELAHKTPYYAIFHVLAYCGLRRGEAVALKWAKIDYVRGVLSVVETAQRLAGKGIVFQPTKSAAGRRGIKLDPKTIRVLRAHNAAQAEYRLALGPIYENHDLVFPGSTGKPLDPSVLTRNFARMATNAGMPGIRLHDLRHAHASALIKVGAHPRVVQDRMGHASSAFTMQAYGHVAADQQEEAANAVAELMEEAP